MQESDLASAYADVTGAEPLEAARVLLQRLPGLTAREQEHGGRSFVDGDMLDALAGGALASFVANPYARPGRDKWRHAVGDLGCSVAATIGGRNNVPVSLYAVAAAEALRRWDDSTLGIACAVAGAKHAHAEPFHLGGLVFREGAAAALDLDETQLSGVSFEYCDIQLLVLGDASPRELRVAQSLIGRVVGCGGPQGLPAWVEACEVGEYENIKTNAAIVALDIPPAQRVLLTILRKLFLQRGSGRQESALHRGLGPGLRDRVKPVLALLEKHHLVYSSRAGGNVVYYGVRGVRSRVLQCLTTLGKTPDPLVEEVNKIA